MPFRYQYLLPSPGIRRNLRSAGALGFVVFIAIAAVAADTTTDAARAQELEALPVGQTTLPDGRVMLKDADGKVLQLSNPERFKDRYFVPEALSDDERKECDALSSGMHTLTSGRQVLKFDSGEIQPLPPKSFRPAVSKTAIQVHPGVWVEPELKQTIDTLRDMPTAKVLDSLQGPNGPFNIRVIATNLVLDGWTYPPEPTQGYPLLHDVLHDMRFDRLLKDLEGLSDDECVSLIKPRLNALADEQRQIFADAMKRFQESNRGANGDDSPARLMTTIESIDSVVTARPDYEVSPRRGHALNALLLLAAQRRLEALRPLVLDLAQLAVEQRAQIYATTQEPGVVLHLLDKSLYLRQALATALVETSPDPEALLRDFHPGMGLHASGGVTVPFDAYSTNSAGLAHAKSGPGRPYRVVQAISDETFDRLLAP